MDKDKTKIISRITPRAEKKEGMKEKIQAACSFIIEKME
jgi:hypothetical protein